MVWTKAIKYGRSSLKNVQNASYNILKLYIYILREFLNKSDKSFTK